MVSESSDYGVIECWRVSAIALARQPSGVGE
jgi:hypothetical protein